MKMPKKTEADLEEEVEQEEEVVAGPEAEPRKLLK